MPQRIGISRKKPLPSKETSTVTRSEVMDIHSARFSGTRWVAPSPVLPRAMFTATGARIRPITMMTGPVTMGGSTRSTISVPRQRIRPLRRKYTNPEHTSPPRVCAMPQVCTP